MCNQCANFPHCLINIFRVGLSQDSNKSHTLYLVDMVLASGSNFLGSRFTFSSCRILVVNVSVVLLRFSVLDFADCTPRPAWYLLTCFCVP